MNGMDAACQVYLKEVTSFVRTETGIMGKDTDRNQIGVVKKCREIAEFSSAQEAESAHKLSDEALAIFEDHGELRGVGLASITLGRALRQSGGANNLAKAAKHLKRAVSIFTPQSVHEPVRLIEAQRELGCVYRDLANLAYSHVLNPSLAERFDDAAVQYLVTAIKLAKGKYPVLYVDSCFDMAQTCIQSQRFDLAESWVERAQQAICARQRAADHHSNFALDLANSSESLEKLPDAVLV